MLMMAMIVAVVGTFSSCKDYEEDNLNEIKGDYATLKQQLADMANELANCCSDIKTQVGNVNVVELESTVNDLKNKINDPKSGLDALLSAYSDVLAEIGRLKNEFVTKTDYDNKIQEIESKLHEACDCTSQITGLTNDLAALETLVKEGTVSNDEFTNFKNDYDEYVASVNKILGENLPEGVTLASVNEKYQTADAELQRQIDEMKATLEKYEKELIALRANLSKLVTSVIVQGTYNPVFGSFSLPLGLKSTVLAAYYGYSENNVDFPSASTGMYFNTDKLTSEDMAMINLSNNLTGEVQYSSGDLLLEEEKGNAGTIYLTVNPSAVDFSGLGFSLVNSIDEESPVTLGMLMPSSKKLTFGWTRGAAANGFYEAKATVTPENLEKAKLTVDFTKQDLINIFKDVTSPRDGIDIKNIANVVYTAVNDICDATGVKASWTEESGVSNEIAKNSVVSEYSIAATAVKPLFFSTLKDYHMDTFWGVSTIKNFINKLIDKININIGGMDHFEFTIDHISFKPLEDDGTYKVTVTINDVVQIDGTNINFSLGGEGDNGVYDVLDENGKVIGSVDLSTLGEDISISGSFPIEVECTVDIYEFMERIYGELTGDVESQINQILNDLDGFVNDVNAMIDQINDIQNQIDDTKESIANQINNYIDQINKRLCNLVNSVHDRLQPLAIAYDGRYFYTLSEVKNKPTKLAGNTLNIVPTTYTAEMIAPAFKKHLAVTNVFRGSNDAQSGNADCQNALKNANSKGDMNKVVAGTVRNIEFVGESGYKYEIAYSALGYNGKAVTKKFYVTVP